MINHARTGAGFGLVGAGPRKHCAHCKTTICKGEILVTVAPRHYHFRCWSEMRRTRNGAARTFIEQHRVKTPN